MPLTHDASSESDVIFGGTKYQPLTEGTVIGRVHIVLYVVGASLVMFIDSLTLSLTLLWIRGNEVDATLEITPDTILICELVPNDIPIVAALVTSQLQTPLCHVALLSQNRKSPNIAVRDIIMVREPHARDRLCFRLADTRRDSNEKDDAVLALDGKPARLTANLQTWSLEAVSESELEAWTAERKRSVTVVQQPMVSTSVKRLIDITAEAKALADSRGELAANVGAKAQQIALVESSAVRKDRPRVKILEAFAVPFHYFCEHFARSGGDKLLAAIETERAETVQVDPLTSSAALRDSLTASAMFRAANSSYDEGTQSRNVRESGFDSILRMSGQVAPEIAAIELAPSLTEQLQRVRDAIIAAPINDELVAAIRAQIAAWRRAGVLGERQGVIFRSSTNVEDLPGTRWHKQLSRHSRTDWWGCTGFNGAGLYLSEPVSASDLDDAHAIESAIKRVWASLFDAAGYKERAFFGIEQQKVAMALLVQPYVDRHRGRRGATEPHLLCRAHRFLDGELVHCNGVAVTRNPFRKDFPGYYLNVQLGAEHRVTDAATGHTPEQVLIYNDGGQPTPDILSLSSLTNGERVLTPDDIPALFGVFRYLANKWHRTLNNFLIAVDIEFLILKDEKRSIVVLQVRPI